MRRSGSSLPSVPHLPIVSLTLSRHRCRQGVAGIVSTERAASMRLGSTRGGASCPATCLRPLHGNDNDPTRGLLSRLRLFDASTHPVVRLRPRQRHVLPLPHLPFATHLWLIYLLWNEGRQKGRLLKKEGRSANSPSPLGRELLKTRSLHHAGFSALPHRHGSHIVDYTRRLPRYFENRQGLRMRQHELRARRMLPQFSYEGSSSFS